MIRELRQPAFTQIQLALQRAMHVVSDSPALAQRIQLLALHANRVKQQSLHRQIPLSLVWGAPLGSAEIDRVDLVLELMQKIVIQVSLPIGLRRPPAFFKEINRGLQHQMTRLSLFAVAGVFAF